MQETIPSSPPRSIVLGAGDDPCIHLGYVQPARPRFRSDVRACGGVAVKPEKTVDKRITPAFAAQAGKGRPKGVQNKVTMQVKEMVIAALSKAGGVDYLVEQAEKSPTAFLSLVGKVIPLQVAGDPDNPVKHVFELSDAALAVIATRR